jgi:hypothetical protein
MMLRIIIKNGIPIACITMRAMYKPNYADFAENIFNCMHVRIN